MSGIRKAFSNTVNIIITVVLAAMVGMVFVNAVARYVFSSGFPITEELSRFAFVWTSFLGAIIAFWQDKHVGVDILLERFHGLGRLIFQLIGEVFVAFALTAIGLGAWQYFDLTATTKSPASGLPFGVVSSAGLVLVVCMAVRTAVNIKKHFDEYRKYKTGIATGKAEG